MNKSDLKALGKPAKARADSVPASAATDVEAAERVVQELTEKRERIAHRVREISEERRTLAFAAHASADQDARSRLDALNSEGATIAGEFEGIDAAIAEANRRLGAARQAADLEVDRAHARELRSVLAKFVEHGRKTDQALAALINETSSLRETLTQMHGLGCDFPSHALADTNARLAVVTALMQTPWRREFEHLAPRERRTFTELVNGWAARIEPAIRQRLGETGEKEAA